MTIQAQLIGHKTITTPLLHQVGAIDACGHQA